jgi:hypothetical protein
MCMHLHTVFWNLDSKVLHTFNNENNVTYTKKRLKRSRLKQIFELVVSQDLIVFVFALLLAKRANKQMDFRQILEVGYFHYLTQRARKNGEGLNDINGFVLMYIHM